MVGNIFPRTCVYNHWLISFESLLFFLSPAFTITGRNVLIIAFSLESTYSITGHYVFSRFSLKPAYTITGHIILNRLFS